MFTHEDPFNQKKRQWFLNVYTWRPFQSEKKTMIFECFHMKILSIRKKGNDFWMFTHEDPFNQKKRQWFLNVSTWRSFQSEKKTMIFECLHMKTLSIRKKDNDFWMFPHEDPFNQKKRQWFLNVYTWRPFQSEKKTMIFECFRMNILSIRNKGNDFWMFTHEDPFNQKKRQWFLNVSTWRSFQSEKKAMIFECLHMKTLSIRKKDNDFWMFPHEDPFNQKKRQWFLNVYTWRPFQSEKKTMIFECFHMKILSIRKKGNDFWMFPHEDPFNQKKRQWFLGRWQVQQRYLRSFLRAQMYRYRTLDSLCSKTLQNSSSIVKMAYLSVFRGTQQSRSQIYVNGS